MSGGGVAAGHDLTAAAAHEVLAAGGTAVDAALAGGFMAMAAEPVLAGLLGGGFLMVREPGGRTGLLDFFVQTPRRAVPPGDLDFRAIEARFGTATQTFHVGAGSIATPGAAPGMAEAHAAFGRIPLAELIAPAAKAAREGVRITAYQAQLGQVVAAILTASPEAEALFCHDGAPLAEGAVQRNPALGDVLEVFGLEGPRFVTEGEVGQALLAVTDRGGHLGGDDLRRYRPVWRTPLAMRRGDVEIALNPPPALGGVLIALALDLAPHRPDPASIADVLALTGAARIEAELDRDPMGGALRLRDPALLGRYRDLVGRARSVTGTTQISVIDGAGMGAALTLSNGAGSGMVVPGTGIMANNMLGEADLLPDGFESWGRDQRMSSMMAPMALSRADGQVTMLGSGGSNRIRSALGQVALGLIDRGLSLDEAIAAPRLHAEGAKIDFEDFLDDGDRAALLAAWPEARGWPDRSMFFGGVHAVRRGPRGGIDAAGDPRRSGVALA